MKETYPFYYIVRSRENEGEPVIFIKVPNPGADVAYPDEIFGYLKRHFDFEKITRPEAETYEVFGIAPIVLPKEFINWVVEQIDKGELPNVKCMGPASLAKKHESLSGKAGHQGVATKEEINEALDDGRIWLNDHSV